MKLNKKTLAIFGVVGFGLYFLFGLIMIVVLNARVSGSFSTFLSSFWSWFKFVIMFGYLAFYLIYNMVKKSDKGDKVVDIILAVDFGLLFITGIVTIVKLFGNLIDYGEYYTLALKVEYVMTLFVTLINMAVYVLLAISVIGMILKKKFPYKLLLTIAGIGLLVTILFYLLSDLVSYFNGAELFTFVYNILGLLRFIGSLVLFGSMVLFLNSKAKEIN